VQTSKKQTATGTFKSIAARVGKETLTVKGWARGGGTPLTDGTSQLRSRDSGVLAEVEVSLGACEKYHSLDHFGCGAVGLHPQTARELAERLAGTHGPFGPGKPLDGQRTGILLIPISAVRPAVSPRKTFCMKVGTKVQVVEPGPLLGYCGTVVGHEALTRMDQRDREGQLPSLSVRPTTLLFRPPCPRLLSCGAPQRPPFSGTWHN
jgi:hypothetical protein